MLPLLCTYFTDSLQKQFANILKYERRGGKVCIKQKEKEECDRWEQEMNVARKERSRR